MAKLTVADVPHMFKMWDTQLNTEKPENVSVHCTDKKNWRCPDCGHTWPTSPKSRYRSSGKCPCHESNKVIRRGVNDILTIVKGLDAFLDDDNDFDAIYHQGLDSSLPVNFKCDECGRTWTAILKSQVKKNENGGYIATGCPHYNTTKRKKADVPFCSEVESIIRFWDDKNPLNPQTTKSNSNEPAHFICKNCGYDWTTELRSQTRGTGKCKCCELQLVTRKGITDVFTLIPESKNFYNFEKNENIDIFSISLRNYDIQIDWKCPTCSREWQSPLASRIKGKKGEYSFIGCQKCYLHDSKRITPVASVPKLIKYWDFKKNGHLDTNLTSAYADIPANWRCKKCGHEWNTIIRSRMNSDILCPMCDGIHKPVVKGINDVLTICPELAQIYDFETNEKNGINIYKEGVYSNTKAHYKCKKCKNEWDSPINNRVRKHKNGTFKFRDCPECSNKLFRKIPYSVEFPLLAQMYREDLNNIPLDSIRGEKAIIDTYYHWECPTCHETFESTLNAMKESHKTPTHGCQYCSHTKVRKGESFGDIHPNLVEEYDPSNEIDIFMAFPNGKESVKWICKDCRDTWNATFALRHMGYGKCPKCYKVGRNIKEECFAAVYPEYVDLWSSDNERTPYDTFYTSNLWIHWNCTNCGNVYGANINEFVSGNVECPYCRGIKLNPKTNSLRALYPNITRRWSKNNLIESNMVLPTAGTFYKWICDTCHGEYSSPVKDVVAGSDECPYCKGTKVLAGFNSFGDKHTDLLEEMDKVANYLLPYTEFDVSDTSNKKFWWICHKNPKHKYPMSPRNRLMFQKRNREPCLYCRGQRRKLNHFIAYSKEP